MEMDFTVEDDQNCRFVRVSVRGRPLLAGVLSFIGQVSRLNLRGRNLLIDLRAVSEVPETAVQAIAGEEIACRLGQVRKIASLVPPGARTGKTEQVAQRFGANLRVFTDQGAAVAWLSREG